jgi:hypothetical protein
MFYNCNPNFHVVTALTPDPADTPTSLIMTITNSGNISSLDKFCLVLARNPYNEITGEPVPFQVTVNGTNVPLLNKYSLPIYSNRLNMRKPYVGSYVVPEDGDPYVILWNTPCNPAYATPNITPVTTGSTTSASVTTSSTTSDSSTRSTSTKTSAKA